MTQTLTIQLPKLHESQRHVLSTARRFNVLCCGRRWGKSTLALDILLRTALVGRPAAYCTPTYKMLSEVWRAARLAAAPVTRRVSEQEHRLELITGGVIDMWSLDHADVARGRRYATSVIDEAAMIPHLADAWTAVIRPTLVDYAGDAWFPSTPRGLNYYHDLYQRGHAGDYDDWQCWQMPTSANPYIPAAEIEAARSELPERVFEQEFMARFLEFEGAVFRRVQEAATAVQQSEALPGHSYAMGVDWGKHNDYTWIAVLDTTTRELVAQDRYNRIDYSLQRARLQALWERFGRPEVTAESNSMGEPVIEELRRSGIPVRPFLTTNASKAQAIEALALAFEQDTLRILPDPVLLGELMAYTAERLPSGLLRYSAPEGLHDDGVVALALAWQAASRPVRRPHTLEG